MASRLAGLAPGATYALLARCRKQAADREDILQEALLALVQALREPDGVACVFGFLRTALWLHEMKLERANGRPLSALPEDGQELEGRDLSSGGELDLHQRLAEMPRLHREWSQLFVQQTSPAAIAHRANVKITTVYMWAHRIRTWIRGLSRAQRQDPARSRYLEGGAQEHDSV